ncbi:MAG: hypothetical protein QG635_1402, partial [Bacteroidota bacterium]|nr:hypothetical protein [Bacteroidota bacterium]
DNAMGVAALLEIAEAMDKMPVKPLRSVIFLLTTGEEKGLLGSSYYTGHPVKPLYKTIANVNIDGIAYFEQFRSIVGIGADYSTLEHNLLNVAAKMGIKPDKIPQESIQGESFAYSDQYSFARAGVPSVLIYEGSEYHHSSYKKGLERLINYSLNVYHTPFDDMNQQINYEAAEEHINLIYNFCLDLANDMMEPEWNYNSPFLNERLRTKAERR